jgi:hypothetical protein
LQQEDEEDQEREHEDSAQPGHHRANSWNAVDQRASGYGERQYRQKAAQRLPGFTRLGC